MAAASRAGGDPPESTRLRIGDDIAWSEINGVYNRDDSLRENTNPKCILKNHHPGAHNATGSSQRFSGNLKPTAAPIIGLSGRLGGGGAGGQGARRQNHPPAMFPKKAKTGGGGHAPKAAVPEPGSPKVSCIGKVLSDRERARLGRPPRPRRGSGCCGGFGLGFLMRRSRSRNAVDCVDQSPPPPRSLPPVPEAARRRETKVVEAAAAPAPGLGGMRRFASGRRAVAEWAVEMEDDGRVARSGPL